MTEAIATHELIKTYGNGVRALARLTFGVEEGAVFGLLDPNGAGKSTTVKILATLTRADAGRALVARADVAAEAAAVRCVIGLVGQRSAVDREATVQENIRLQTPSGSAGGLWGGSRARTHACCSSTSRRPDWIPRCAARCGA